MTHKRIFIILAVAGLFLTGCSATGGTGSGVAPAGNAAPSTSAVPAVNWYDATYGTFAPVTSTGTTATVIPLPTGAKAGVITAEYSGTDNFIISVLDKANQPTIDGPVNTIGAYKGVTGFGFTPLGERGTQLQVTATGPWTITISPVSAAAAAKPTSGTGDAVFLYAGASGAWTFTNSGTGNFIVDQYSSNPMPGANINQIGAYTGKVPVYAGPSVIVLKSDGAWTIE